MEGTELGDSGGPRADGILISGFRFPASVLRLPTSGLYKISGDGLRLWGGSGGRCSTLIVDWLLFLPGVVLLLIPATALLSKRVQLRTFESFHSLDNTRRYRRWWWVPALWLDPLRAFGGVWLVKTSLDLSSAYWSQTPGPDFTVLTGLLVGAVIVQLYTRREEGVLLAPMGFLIGLIAALVPWPVALVAMVGGLVGLFGFRHFAGFFLGAGLGVGFFGYVFEASPVWLPPLIAVCFLPLAACLVTGKALELPTRDASDEAGKMS